MGCSCLPPPGSNCMFVKFRVCTCLLKENSIWHWKVVYCLNFPDKGKVDTVPCDLQHDSNWHSSWSHNWWPGKVENTEPEWWEFINSFQKWREQEREKETSGLLRSVRKRETKVIEWVNPFIEILLSSGRVSFAPLPSLGRQTKCNGGPYCWAKQKIKGNLMGINFQLNLQHVD